ncbi:MAG: TetR family transcriptional regulator C-terminal domain-containing protein [Thermodesulfobacteriota bacterium]
MTQDTKHRIIEAGARIIHRKGYFHTGIQEVLDSAGVPKGSFYFYFNGKEDFGLQVVDYYNSLYLVMLDPILGDKSLPALKRIERILDHFIGVFTERECTCGCPIGNLSQEMGDLSPAFSSKLAASVEVITDVYKKLLDEAKAAQEISQETDTRDTAEFIVSSWHGSLIRMKITKSTAPLMLHKQFVLGLLRRDA